jgi:hypothetical protein
MGAHNQTSQKSKLYTKQLTTEEFQKLEKASRDPFFFALFIFVIHPILGKVPFKLYPYQRAVLWNFINERFNIILKFRQAGITELISMYCLWLAMFHPHKNIVIISIKDRVAKKVLRKIKYMYKNLPDYLKQPIVNGRGDDIGTATEIEFANGSMITSIPTTEEAGRSEAVSLMVIDEAAIVRWINKIWAAAFPTLSTGGAAIVNSTPYGVGNWFHKQWVDACSGASNFMPNRLYWRMHPERDEVWYEAMKAELGARKTAQEVDGDFLSSGNTVFDLWDIKAIEDYLDDYQPIEYRNGGNLRIYKKPDKKEEYFIGADISTGRSNDFSAFSVMNRAGEEFASFKGKMPVSRFARLLMKVGYEYNTALIAPETNDIGLSVTSDIDEANYPKLYYSKALSRKKKEKKPEEKDIPGWYTSRANRPVIINELEEDVRKDALLIKDPEFTREAYTFIYDSNGRPAAMGKKSSGSDSDSEIDDDQAYTDDTILSKAITNHIRKTSKPNFLILPT